MGIKLYNLARMLSSTTGTGSTVALDSAVSGFLTWALSGVANGETVRYGIKDGANSEVGTAVYSSSGPSMTRTVLKSTNSDTAISLSGTAEVYITAAAEDFQFASTSDYIAVTTTYAILGTDGLIDCTGGSSFTVTLPTAVGCQRKRYAIKLSGTGVITIATTSSQTIDGNSGATLSVQGSILEVESDGANWIVV